MRTHNIGHAAFAFTRFQFVRALIASAFVNIPIVVLIVSVTAAAAVAHNDALREVFATIIVVALSALLLASLTLTLNIFDRLHRRIAAFVSLYGVLLLPLMIVERVYYWQRTWDGTWQARDAGLALVALSLFDIAVGALGVLLAFELACLAVWSIFAPKAAYLSVRGWRPKWFELPRNLTHQLGFPTYAAYIRRGRLGLGGRYLLIALLDVAFFGVLTAPLWFPNANGSQGAEVMAVVLLLAPATAATLHLAGVGKRLDRNARQKAADLYQSVREWDDRPPVLFLRSFNQDQIAIAAVTRDPMLRLPTGLGRKRELDELLLEAGAPFGPIVAIGDPRNPIPPLGAARVFVKNAEENWQSVVSDLIAAARAIVICPHTPAGVAWEIEQVRAPAVLARTIIIASPGMSAEETSASFGRITPEPAQLRPGRFAVAAFQDPVDGWTLLSARRLTVQTYTVALNRALQRLLRDN
jgi:hypothetical protein